VADNGVIVFYCKKCDGMFFAAVVEFIGKETSKDIAKYLTEGHRLEKVSPETVRREWANSSCIECSMDERQMGLPGVK